MESQGAARLIARWWMALCVAAFAAAGQAGAQGFYYKEVVQDGRVYVFNDAEAAARFEASGEMGRSIARPGAGPNGETVIADSERALQLYFFKHGIAEAVLEPNPPVQRIEWRDGKTRITTDNAYLEISSRLQPRYTHEFPGDSSQLPGTAEPGDDKGSFRMRRAKFKLEGWVWTRALSYELQVNWVELGTARPGNALEDANIAWDVSGDHTFRIVFGQFKAPFGRQELTTFTSQHLADRSLVSNEFARGREMGIAVQGVLWDNRLEYRGGVFNGNGRTQPTNDNDTFQVNARLMWQPNGSQPLASRAWVSSPLYSESDFESTTTPIYAFGIDYDFHDLWRIVGNPAVNLRSHTVGIDGVFKFKGFSTVGEHFWRTRRREAPLAGFAREFGAPGSYVQFGQMLNARRTWEAVFRYGTRDVDDTIADNDVTEIRGGLNYHVRRSALKIQADFGQVETGQGPGRDASSARELRVQSIVVF